MRGGHEHLRWQGLVEYMSGRLVPVGCGRWLCEVADPLWLQVSAFGGNEQSDSGDVWAVQLVPLSPSLVDLPDAHGSVSLEGRWGSSSQYVVEAMHAIG